MFVWTVHLNGGPKRSYHAAVIVEHKVFSFGGEDNNDSDLTEVHVFNTVSLYWMKLSPVTPGRGECSLEVPSSRKLHTAVLIEYTIYIWGGLITNVPSNVRPCAHAHDPGMCRAEQIYVAHGTLTQIDL